MMLLFAFKIIFYTKEERCLIDNLWVPYHKNPKDVKYFIICLNDLSDRFGQAIERFKFCVVFKGKEIGLFHTWIEVLDATRGFPNPKYKGFNNYHAAIFAAQESLGEKVFISPSLKSYANSSRLLRY